MPIIESQVDRNSDEFKQNAVKMIPLGRVGKPEDVASAVTVTARMPSLNCVVIAIAITVASVDSTTIGYRPHEGSIR